MRMVFLYKIKKNWGQSDFSSPRYFAPNKPRSILKGDKNCKSWNTFPHYIRWSLGGPFSLTNDRRTIIFGPNDISSSRTFHLCWPYVDDTSMDRRTCGIKCGFAKWFEMFLRLVFDVESIFYIPKHPRLLYHALLGMLVVIDMKSNSWVWLGTDILELNQAFSFKKTFTFWLCIHIPIPVECETWARFESDVIDMLTNLFNLGEFLLQVFGGLVLWAGTAVGFLGEISFRKLFFTFWRAPVSADQ